MINFLFRRNWKTTVSGLITGAALGYGAYKTGSAELAVAAIGALSTGVMGSDAMPKDEMPKK